MNKQWTGPAFLVALIAGIAAWLTLPVDRWLLGVVDWIAASGPVGVLAFAALYITATVLMAPGSVLTLGAGFVWGPIWGLAIVSPVSVLAATASFLVGRTILRDRLRRQVADRPRLSAIDRAVSGGGLKLVLLLRLSPVVPFNLLNYALGASGVRARDYVLGSFVGMLPGTLLYVYLGSLLTNVAQLTDGRVGGADGARQIFYWGGLLVTLAVVILVARAARRELQRAAPEAALEPAE